MDVEFLPEDEPPAVPPAPPVRRGRPLMIVVAGVAAVGAVAIALHHGHRHPVAQPAPVTQSPLPNAPALPSATCRDISCGSHASGVIEAMVAQHLPGATVIDETSMILRPDGLLGTASLGARTLEVIYRGTVITVRVQSGPSGPPSATHFVHAGYGIDVTSSGPVRVDAHRLQALAADPRLTAP